MVDAAVPMIVWHRRMTSSVHMIREPRAHPATALTRTHWRVSLATSHMRRGMRPRVTRRFSRACSMEVTTEPWFVVLGQQEGDHVVLGDPLVAVVEGLAAAGDGEQRRPPNPADRGRSTKSSVWVFTRRAVPSARSR